MAGPEFYETENRFSVVCESENSKGKGASPLQSNEKCFRPNFRVKVVNSIGFLYLP